MDTDALARYCESLWNARAAINATMDEIARYVAPDRQGFTSGKLDASDEGRDKIWDSTPEDAALTLASALHGMLTNPATEWLALELMGLEQETNEETDEFLQNVNKAMLAVFSDADTGFQQEVNTFYMDLVCFGWAVFLCEMKDGKGLRFRAVPPSQCALAENSDGRVDTVLRRWTMTPGQMAEEFGADALSGQVKDALEGRNQSKTFPVSHLVAPREKMPGDLQLRTGRRAKKTAREAAFVSVYFETQNKNILREGIFLELPYMVPRWGKRSGEVYGRGPGHSCLPDMRVLNRVAFSQLVGAEKLADPPLLVADDSAVGKIKTHAGGITMYRPMSSQGEEIRQLPVTYQLDVAEVVLEKRREAIRAAFLNDRIQLAGGPQMTATEVIARERKQNIVLGPVLGRLESEFLGPMSGRVFLLLYRGGALNPPETLEGRDLRARYLSPIGRAQRQGEAEAFSRALEYLAPAAQADPTILDNFDFNAAARDSREMFGFPREYLRSEEEVEKIRQARAEAQAEAAMAAQLAAKAGI